MARSIYRAEQTGLPSSRIPMYAKVVLLLIHARKGTTFWLFVLDSACYNITSTVISRHHFRDRNKRTKISSFDV